MDARRPRALTWAVLPCIVSVLINFNERRLRRDRFGKAYPSQRNVMKRTLRSVGLTSCVATLLALTVSSSLRAQAERHGAPAPLSTGWMLQSSCVVKATGEQI